MATAPEFKKFHISSTEERDLMKDPAKVACRIFVGNLPTDEMEREDLKELFSKFGTVTGVLLNRGFGFVQFETEASAADAIKNGSTVTFNGKKVDVRPARRHGNDSKDVKRDRSPINDYFDRGRDVTRFPVDSNSVSSRVGSGAAAYRLGYSGSSGVDRANDCEIIVVNKKQMKYAEYIEVRLKKLGLTVDLLFPNEDVPVTRVLANIASRGSLYAILILPQNEDHNSLTLNILHGQPQEHRNMPLEDAISLLARNFDAYLLREKASRPSEVSVVPAAGPLTAINLTDRHPEAIQVESTVIQTDIVFIGHDVTQSCKREKWVFAVVLITDLTFRSCDVDSAKDRLSEYFGANRNSPTVVLLNLLADNRQLTVLQYDKVITYLQGLRELQLKVELGDTTIPTPAMPAIPMQAAVGNQKQQELQSRILNILNNKASNIVQPVITPPVTQPQTPILSDPNVQKALDSLIQGDILKKISNNPRY